MIVGRGPLVEWLKQEEVKETLLFAEESDPTIVTAVTAKGYAPDLDEAEQEMVGHDPFLIAYGVVDPDQRCVVSFEVSAPSKKRANRKVPDVCADLGVKARHSAPANEPMRVTTTC